MSIPHPPPRQKNSPSFALISVLALVSLAALTATAFLASARLEKRATMSLSNSTRLEMALNAGACAAAEMLDYAPSKHFNFVTTYWRGTNPADWTNELGYLLNGAVNSSSVQTSTVSTFYCCFSTATFTNLSNSASALVSVSNNVTNQGTFLQDMGKFMQGMTNFAAGQSTNIPMLGGQTSPPVGWVYIRQDVRTKPGLTNTTNIPVVRFAFYVQDLGGLLDAERMGGTNARNTGTNPEEISLTNAVGTSLTSAGKASTLVSSNNRWKYLSPGMLTLPDAGGLTTNDLRYVAAGLIQWTNAWARIPVGLGYKNSEEIKFNPNTNTNVSQISSFLGGNLTGFTNRAGAMNGNAYLQNIAANLVDYLDTDSTPTVDSSDSPSYLGIENLPWPNELFDRIGLSNVTSAGMIQIELKDWVEVWNMGNKPIKAGTTISISNNYDMVLTFSNQLTGSSFKTNLNQMQFLSGSLGRRDFALLGDLLPNGYTVLENNSASPTRRLGVQLTNPALYATTTIRNGWRLLIQSADETSKMEFAAYSGNTLIQQSKGGRWPRYYSGSLNQKPITPNNFVFGNPVGFASQTNSSSASAKPWHSGGDPRSQLFLSDALRAQNYTNKYASPGGRNWENANIASFPESEVQPAKYWPDNGHASSGDRGANPTTYDDRPDSFTIAPITNNWVMRRNDTGTMTNIMELGSIYDPMQWSDQNGSGVSGQPGLWTNLTVNATPDARFGGRNTLRIGRWEFSRFAFTNLAGATVSSPNMMQSAAALLDLFATTNQYDEGGKVNLNTAPAPVLRALAGGIYLTSDPALLPSGTNCPIPASMTEAFAQGVMRFRSKYPFYSPSQISFIGTDPGWPNTNTWPTNAVFGNTNAIALAAAPGNAFGSTTSIGATEWNDQAAEEWFGKIYGLSTTQSRNFRCYVIAQLVDSNQVPTGPVMRKYYHILNRNNTDAQTDTPATISTSTYNIYESPY